jgi:electron transport complex protein RnfC
MHLLPVYLYLYERSNDLQALEKLHLTDCMECGSCTYICPGRLHLVQSFRNGKAKLNALKAKQKQQ